MRGMGCSLVVDLLPSMYKTQSLILSTAKITRYIKMTIMKCEFPKETRDLGSGEELLIMVRM